MSNFNNHVNSWIGSASTSNGSWNAIWYAHSVWNLYRFVWLHILLNFYIKQTQFSWFNSIFNDDCWCKYEWFLPRLVLNENVLGNSHVGDWKTVSDIHHQHCCSRWNLCSDKKFKISKLRIDSDASFDEKLNFMRLLSFYAGILQFAISIFQLGIIFNWLPDFFISAFISGVSFHVITSQVFHMFGIDKKKFSNYQLFYCKLLPYV